MCYAAFKDHCSLFPMSMQVIESHREELEPYLSGKGTIRFGMDERLPTALVKIDRPRARRGERRALASLNDEDERSSGRLDQALKE